MSKSRFVASALAALVSTVALPAAAQSCLMAAADSSIATVPPGAAKVVVFGREAASDPQARALFEFSARPQAGAVWFVGAVDAQRLGQFLAARRDAPERPSYRIQFVNAAGAVLLADATPRVAAQGDKPEILSACKANVEGPVSAARSATREQCRVAVEGRRSSRYEDWVVFNSAGQSCFVPYPLRQRDRIRFGMLVNTGEEVPVSATVTVTGCTAPGPGPAVFASGSLDDLRVKLQSSNPSQAVKSTALQFFEIGNPVECASAAPVAAVNVITADGQSGTANTTLSLVERYTGTVHLGVLQSSLREPDYVLRAVGGQNTIADKEASGRGPEYVALVVVQGIAHYRPWGGGSGLSYPGRDLLHDNEPIDRLGLVIGFGLKDPARRFGLGFSYEIAKGVNVVAVHEWVKRNQLQGVLAGDAFTGAAADIPLRKEWSRDWSFGLSFDLAYITQLFAKK